MKALGPICLLAAAAACTPAGMADSVNRRAAATVVRPVLERDMPSPAAFRATDCILLQASPSELQALARDVGVIAGTLTEANIRTIALRPATQACFAANNVAWSG